MMETTMREVKKTYPEKAALGEESYGNDRNRPGED